MINLPLTCNAVHALHGLYSHGNLYCIEMISGATVKQLLSLSLSMFLLLLVHRRHKILDAFHNMARPVTRLQGVTIDENHFVFVGSGISYQDLLGAAKMCSLPSDSTEKQQMRVRFSRCSGRIGHRTATIVETGIVKVGLATGCISAARLKLSQPHE